MPWNHCWRCRRVFAFASIVVWWITWLYNGWKPLWRTTLQQMGGKWGERCCLPYCATRGWSCFDASPRVTTSLLHAPHHYLWCQASANLFRTDHVGSPRADAHIYPFDVNRGTAASPDNNLSQTLCWTIRPVQASGTSSPERVVCSRWFWYVDHLFSRAYLYHYGQRGCEVRNPAWLSTCFVTAYAWDLKSLNATTSIAKNPLAKHELTSVRRSSSLLYAPCNTYSTARSS